jgi:ribosomal protein S27AE
MAAESRLLSICRPDIAAQWHPTKNGELTPDQVTVGSNRKSWWLCENGHEWPAPVARRTNGTGCPICSGQQVLAGHNDLATLRTDIAKQWHPTKNGKLKPSRVAVSSSRKVWWMCERGHEWQASIGSRTKPSGNGCPVCSGRKVLAGHNDLATLRPDIAAQWHPKLNGDLKPDTVTVGSDRKLWWMCENRHSWEATIASRTHGCGCPACYNNRRSARATVGGELEPAQ